MAITFKKPLTGSDLILKEMSPFMAYTRGEETVVTLTAATSLTLGAPVFRAKGAGLSIPAVAEVQTVVASGTATGQVSFLGTPIPGSATSDTAAVTAGLITTNKAAIIAAWNVANPDAAISDISNSTATITITYEVGTGDVPELAAATSEGITFGAATETTKGTVAGAKWAPVTAATALVDTNEIAFYLADVRGVFLPVEAGNAGDHKVALIQMGNIILKDKAIKDALKLNFAAFTDADFAKVKEMALQKQIVIEKVLGA